MFVYVSIVFLYYLSSKDRWGMAGLASLAAPHSVYLYILGVIYTKLML